MQIPSWRERHRAVPRGTAGEAPLRAPGLHGDAVPENTLPALAAAAALGAAEVEFDLWWSKEGVPAVIHDIDVSRVARVDGCVIDMALDDLRRVDMGARYDK